MTKDPLLDNGAVMGYAMFMNDDESVVKETLIKCWCGYETVHQHHTTTSENLTDKEVKELVCPDCGGIRGSTSLRRVRSEVVTTTTKDRIRRYKVIQVAEVERLNKKVQHLIDKGWEPYKDLLVLGTAIRIKKDGTKVKNQMYNEWFYAQAMVKRETSLKKVNSSATTVGLKGPVEDNEKVDDV